MFEEVESVAKCGAVASYVAGKLISFFKPMGNRNRLVSAEAELSSTHRLRGKRHQQSTLTNPYIHHSSRYNKWAVGAT